MRHQRQCASEQARASGVLLDSLPPRYGEVLLALLDRLEASTLAAEESCTFNQQELHDNLYGWVEKAREQLESQAVTTLKTIAACALIKKRSGL